MTLIRAIVLLALLAWCAGARAAMDPASESAFKAALAGPQRTAHNASLDAARHPLETLKFFGVRRDMAVLEIWPADAWWTEFAGAVIAEKGKYVVAQDDVTGLDTPLSDRIHALSIVYPFNFGKIQLVPFGPPLLMYPVALGSMDFAFIFDDLRRHAANGTAGDMLSGAFASLKPGGTLGVVEARAPGMSEDDAIKLVTSAGFKLVARSALNAKPDGAEPARSTLLFQKPHR